MKVVHRKGSPLDNCFGFVDGTVHPICRPGTVNQSLLYNGHKRVHVIKFQSVVTPDGMIANMYGPVDKLSFLYKIDSRVYRVRRQLSGNIQLFFMRNLKKPSYKNTSLSLPHSQAGYF